jgi:predicted DsbA family dithiol-disulfide isomerase
VPFFVVDGKVGVSGAQGADALVAAFAQARGSPVPG